MNIHEFQAKQIFRDYGIPIQKGIVIEKPEEAIPAAKEIGGDLWVIKAQIHAGGRGKGGGVKLAKSLQEVEKIATNMLGMRLITHQTGSEGKQVGTVYIVEALNIEREFYLGLILDRATEKLVMMLSIEGGMNIEKVAAEMPEKIIKVSIDPQIGFRDFHARKLSAAMNLSKAQIKSFSQICKALYDIYIQKDANLIEVNPLIISEEGDIVALDSKIGFDDNALFRHPDIEQMRDLDEEEKTEREAAQYGLNYVKLDGNVGCMVNGAGLAMSTMDIIKFEGGEPANFLDVGGNATAETIARGFQIILKNPHVKAIFVNIFGGIVRCDRIAKGILEATRKSHLKVPLVVRLDGTNAEEASKILEKSNLRNIIAANDLADGAKKVVAALEGA